MIILSPEMRWFNFTQINKVGESGGDIEINVRKRDGNVETHIQVMPPPPFPRRVELILCLMNTPS